MHLPLEIHDRIPDNRQHSQHDKHCGYQNVVGFIQSRNELSLALLLFDFSDTLEQFPFVSFIEVRVSAQLGPDFIYGTHGLLPPSVIEVGILRSEHGTHYRHRRFQKNRLFRTVPLLRFVIQKRAQVLPLAKTYALRIQNPFTLLAINANHELMGQMPI